MKHFVALAFFIVSVSLTAQVEHAPTVAQCQADQRLWISQLESGERTKLPNSEVMHKRAEEMLNCATIDPDNQHDYYYTGSEIVTEQAQRMLNFLNRHNLYDKFIEEDKAGVR